jgi:hypothetical protein
LILDGTFQISRIFLCWGKKKAVGLYGYIITMLYFILYIILLYHITLISIMLLKLFQKDYSLRSFRNKSPTANFPFAFSQFSGDLVQGLWHGGLWVQCRRWLAGERRVCQKYSPCWARRPWWLKAL